MKFCPHTGHDAPSLSASDTRQLPARGRVGLLHHTLSGAIGLALCLAVPAAAKAATGIAMEAPTAVAAQGAIQLASTEAEHHQAIVPSSVVPKDGAPTDGAAHNHSHVDPGLNLVGFLSANYTHLGSASAQAIDGQAGKFEGALLLTYGRGPFRVLSEAVISDEEIEVERLQFGLELEPGTVIWAGRVHQPSSYWNTEFHHGQYLQNSITRPAIEAWEDDGGVLTQHVAGVLLETERGLANGTTLRVATSAGYAPAFERANLNPFDVVRWNNGARHPAFALRIDVLPDGIGEQAFGIMSGFSGLQARGAGIDNLDHVDQTTIGVYGDVHVGESRWLGSLYRIRNRFDFGQQLIAEHATSWFLHGEYRLNEDWMGYVRHESTLGTDGSRYFANFPGFINERSVVGARFESGSNHAISIETGGAKSGQDRFMELRLQWSAVFH